MRKQGDRDAQSIVRMPKCEASILSNQVKCQFSATTIL